MKRLVPAFLIKWAKAIHDKLIPGDSKVGVSGDLEISGDVTAASFLGDNAKPIYIHPVVIVQPGGTPDEYFGISLMIFDGVNTEYDTLAKVSQKIKDITDAIIEAGGTRSRFPASGSITANNKLSNIFSIEGYYSGDTFYIAIYAMATDGVTETRNLISLPSGTRVFDGVNKLN